MVNDNNLHCFYRQYSPSAKQKLNKELRRAQSVDAICLYRTCSLEHQGGDLPCLRSQLLAKELMTISNNTKPRTQERNQWAKPPETTGKSEKRTENSQPFPSPIPVKKKGIKQIEVTERGCTYLYYVPVHFHLLLNIVGICWKPNRLPLRTHFCLHFLQRGLTACEVVFTLLLLAPTFPRGACGRCLCAVIPAL